MTSENILIILIPLTRLREADMIDGRILEIETRRTVNGIRDQGLIPENIEMPVEVIATSTVDDQDMYAIINGVKHHLSIESSNEN